MVQSPLGRRALRAAVVVCLGLLSLPALAQSADVMRITGTFGTGTKPVGLFQISGAFTCDFSSGAAGPCVGTGTFEERDEDCSNILRFGGTWTFTGLDLSRTGSFQVVATITAPDYHLTARADGSCAYVLIATGTESWSLTATWDGTNGTVAFPPNIDSRGNPVVISGSFRVDRDPPPVFPMVVTSSIDANIAIASADIQFRPQDVGLQGSVFVFALAPQTRVVGGQRADVLKVGEAQGGSKADAPVACVLAQLNSAGQMTAVSSANLAAYLTGVLSAQGASVSILNNVPTPNVAGATFFVGYGANGTAMINGGVNRAAVTVPGSLTCEPKKPQTGWWWNPLEDGRGFSLEVRGNNMFFAAFLYDVSGRSTWYVSTGPASLEGSYYTGPLYAAAGGQTLGGPYNRFPTLTDLGAATLAFNNESSGTLVWPGGTVPIQRFNIVQNGLNLPAVAGQPESGWWWNPDESGRGFFMEWQNGWLDIAGYMYDDNGDPVWYLTVGQIGGTSAARSFSGNWWAYANGMPLYGPWRQNTRTSTDVAPLTITFTSAETALMTLPNGRTTSLRRHRF